MISREHSRSLPRITAESAAQLKHGSMGGRPSIATLAAAMRSNTVNSTSTQAQAQRLLQQEEGHDKMSLQKLKKRLLRLNKELMRAAASSYDAAGAYAASFPTMPSSPKFHSTMLFSIFCLAVEFLQLLAFAFKGFDFHSIDAHYWTYALDVTQISDLITSSGGSSDTTAGIIIYDAVVAIIIMTDIVLPLYVLIMHLFRKNGAHQGIKILVNTAIVTTRLIYIPIMLPLFEPFSCSMKSSTDASALCKFSTLCQIVSVVAIPVHLVFSLLVTQAITISNPKSGSIFASADYGCFNLNKIIMKTILVVFLKVSYAVPLLRAFVFLILSFLLVAYVYEFIPFYRFSVNIVKFTLACELLWGAVISIPVAAIQQTSDSSSASSLATSIIFRIYIAGTLIVACLAPLVMNRRQHLATSMDVALANISVANVKDADEEAAEPVTISQTDERFWEPSQVEIATRFLAHNSGQVAMRLASRMYGQGIGMFPRSARLHLSNAYFEFLYNEDSEKALSLLTAAKSLKPTFFTKLAIGRLKRQILRGKGRTGSKAAALQLHYEPTDSVEFRNLITDATALHNVSKSLIATFWAKLLFVTKETADDVKALINLVFDMEAADQEASAVYEMLVERFPNSARALTNYATYLEEVDKDYEKALEVRTRCRLSMKRRSQDRKSILPETVENKGSSIGKKELAAFKQYKKQVVQYSRSSRWRLIWIIRAVELLVIFVAAGQLIVSNVQITAVDNELGSLRLANSCRSLITEIYEGVRSASLSAANQNFGELSATCMNTMGRVASLTDNATSLYEYTSNYKPVFNLWGTPSVSMDIYLGPNVTPSRQIVKMTLMDATLSYARHATKILNAMYGASASAPVNISYTNLDLRFVLDNGLVILPDSYQTLALTISDQARSDLYLMNVVHYSMLSAILGLFILFGLWLYIYEIKSAKSEREASLKSFFTIPKKDIHALLQKYQDPSAVISVEDLVGSNNALSDGAAKEEEEPDSDDELYGNPEDEVEGDEKNRNDGTFKGYERLGLITFGALSLLALVSIGAMAADVIVAQSIPQFTGLMTSSMDLMHRADRIIHALQDAAIQISDPGIGSLSSNSSRRWASLMAILSEDTDGIISDQDRIYYGDLSVAIPRQVLNSRYSQYILNSSDTSGSAYSSVYSYVDKTVAMGVAPNLSISITPTSLNQAESYRVLISDGYSRLVDQLILDYSRQISLVKTTSIIAFAVILVVALIAHLTLWKQLIDNLIRAEADRTVKLLLLIPVEVANEVREIRDLLGLFTLPQSTAAAQSRHGSLAFDLRRKSGSVLAGRNDSLKNGMATQGGLLPTQLRSLTNRRKMSNATHLFQE